MIKNFFDESKEQSLVKTTIVEKYFWAWAKVIKKHSKKIAYIDLFAGPGRFKDGTLSTPLLILEKAIQDNDLRTMLVTIFNDMNSDFTNTLKSAIQELPGIETLKYPPKIYTEEVGGKIVNQFEQIQLVPTLFFVDPWGYKGLSLRLINSVLKNWGCDCIFFFNYIRINMGLSNPVVKEHMNALFGISRGKTLREKLELLNSTERELAIIEELAQALKEMGGKYVLPFRFRDERGNRTTHHLIFVSKHFKGYEIMKEIMAKESSKTTQGVPSFEYSPADKRYHLLFELSRPLDSLEEQLLSEFAGKQLTMKEIYEQHSVGRPFIEKNYQDALKNLEFKGEIVADPPAIATNGKKARRKNTFSSTVFVMFPSR